MSRQHNTATIFGDYYDHLTDIFYELPVFLLLFLKLRNENNFKILITLFLILIISSTILVSCQEVHISRDNEKARSKSLEKLKNLCIINEPGIIRYFGQGSLHLYVFYLILL